MTFHGPHEAVEIDVRGGRIGQDDWLVLCTKLGSVEASYALRVAGVEVARRGFEAEPTSAARGVAARLLERCRSGRPQPRREPRPGFSLRGAHA